MEKAHILDAIRRITEMEVRFHRVLTLGPNPQDLKILARYQESGLWLADYTLDEQGLLPPDLKRGVLSQDGLYDLLAEYAPG